MIPVNTALKNKHFTFDGRAALGETERFENQRGIVFENDMCRPITGDIMRLFRRAECVASIIAWQRGFATFADRAGVRQTGTHAQYVWHIGWLVNRLGLPAYIVCAKKDAIVMNAPLIRPIRLFGSPCYLAVWGQDGASGIVQDAEDLPAALAARYRAVLDFSCGYGSILRAFPYFVGCDIDRKCLNYIAREIMT